MKVQTDYGEQPIEEVVRCYNLWKKMAAKTAEKRRIINQTEEGALKNRQRANLYYERHREEVLEKRRMTRLAQRDHPQFLD